MQSNWKKILAVALVTGAVSWAPWRENLATAQTIDEWYVVVASPDTLSPYQFIWVAAFSSRSDAQDLAAFYRNCSNLQAAHAIPGKAAFAQTQAGVLDPFRKKIACEIESVE